ncbi:MAG: threonine ammonia-lyase, biosynthetic [Agarilytica sp.]
MPQTYLKRILDARIYDLAIETPLDEAPLVGSRIGNRVLLKREDLQPVFSFKVRGAYNKLLKLDEAQRQAGIVAASAGNHAQGVALAAKHLGIKAIIVMPQTTPAIKVDAVRRRGAKVVLIGDAYDQAAEHAQKLVEEKGMVYIPPFDDPDVIAGQGTVAMEILRQHPAHIDAIFIPVGGGGLCAGMVAYIKMVRPEIKVFAVEAEDSACLKLAMEKGRRGVLNHVGIFAEGVAVAQIGKETFKLMKGLIDGVITANTDEMCAAIKDIFEDTRSIAEPAGALALAGLKKYAQEHDLKDQTLIAVDSGANTNFDRLRYISERTEIGEQREAIFAVTIPEKPGSYKKFCNVIGKRAITEFNYRFADNRDAHIFVGLQISAGSNDRENIVATLEKAGYPVVDMTDNDLAKNHIRHMVGGHSPVVDNELIYRFQFPERPGALLNFLTKLAGRWNISMFHYRNHGSAFGRVLVGLQVPNSERKELEKLLDELQYSYWDETNNPAFKLFLD